MSDAACGFTLGVHPKVQGPTGVQNWAFLRVFRVSHWCKGNRINGTYSLLVELITR